MIPPTLTYREALAPAEPSAPDEPILAERLRACARLLEATADELVAMSSGDVVKRREAAAARADLIRELCVALEEEPAAAEKGEDDGMGDPSAHPSRDSERGALEVRLPREVAKVLADALDALEERDEEERRMQDRWASLEGDALKAIHVGGRIMSLRAGRYPEGRQTDPRLDLRF